VCYNLCDILYLCLCFLYLKINSIFTHNILCKCTNLHSFNVIFFILFVELYFVSINLIILYFFCLFILIFYLNIKYIDIILNHHNTSNSFIIFFSFSTIFYKITLINNYTKYLKLIFNQSQQIMFAETSKSLSTEMNDTTNSSTNLASSIDLSETSLSGRKRTLNQFIHDDQTGLTLSPVKKKSKLDQQFENDIQYNDDDDMLLSQESLEQKNNEDDLEQLNNLLTKFKNKKWVSFKEFDDFCKSEQKDRFKWFFIAKVCFKKKGAWNGSPDSCILDDYTKKIVVKSFDKNVVSKLELNQVYWFCDYSKYAEVKDKKDALRYIDLPSMNYFIINATTGLYPITKMKGWNSRFKLDVFDQHPVINQSSTIKTKEGIKKVNRKIKYYTDIKPNGFESGYVENDSLIKQTGRNITGVITSLNRKKNKNNTLYISLRIQDQTESFLINIFNIFEQDVSKFEQLKEKKGVIALINFGIKINNGKKFFNIDQGYYLLDVKHDAKELLTKQLEIKYSSLIPNATCNDVRQTYLFKKTTNIEYFIVKAKVTKVKLGYDEIPFKFFITETNEYANFDKENKLIFYKGTNISSSNQSMEIKPAISLTISDDNHYVNQLHINLKVFKKIFVNFETDNMLKLFNQWLTDSDEFEEKLEEAEEQQYYFKIYIHEWKGIYYKRICEAQLLSK